MINSVILVGRLTRDPEVKQAKSDYVCNFTLATEDFNKNAHFISCVCWGPKCNALANSKRKGHLLGVKGKLQTRSYEDRDGKKITVTEVFVEELDFLGQFEKSKDETDTSSQERRPTVEKQSVREEVPQDLFNQDSVELEDDDLPF